MTNDNTPSIGKIWGTVVESLAETIRNRETIISELRTENNDLARLAKFHAEAFSDQTAEVHDLRREVEGWKLECEIHEKDEAEIRRLRAEFTSLRHRHLDHCNTLLSERDHARRLFCEWSAGSDRPGEKKEDIARANGWSSLYENDSTPSLFPKQKSDSDPRTGVQYGDLH